MSQFDYLKSFDVQTGKVASMELYDIDLGTGRVPILIGKCAGEMNKPYFNEVLKTTSRKARMLQAGNISTTFLSENRDQDRELYPLYVLSDWIDVVNTDFDPVPFSPSACGEFIAALPDHVFDKVRQFFSNPVNFSSGFNLDEAEEEGKG